MVEMHCHHLYMSQMNWGAIDLNLLVVFDAVMQERNVTRAGAKVGLSQPAMSHALNRLRYMLKDQLFVRTPEGMVPTPRAEQLAGPLRQALSELQSALEPEAFDPSKAERRFTIAVNNYGAIVVAPPLVCAAALAAPLVQLDLRPSGTLRVFEMLDRGELDLAFGNYTDAGERFGVMPLLSDNLVVMLRSAHPAADGDLNPEALAKLEYLVINSSPIDTRFLDEWLAGHQLRRRIAARVPRLAMAHILARTDLAVVLSRRIAEAFAATADFVIRELPCPAPVTVNGILWHRRLDNQPAHRWLRDLVQSVCQKR